MDYKILEVQKWLNSTYKENSDFINATYENGVPENGQTGWPTIFGLVAALQIELGFSGDHVTGWWDEDTYNACPNIYGGEESNLVYIVQGGLWCKGYNPGGFTGYYGNGTYQAVGEFKADAGFTSASGNMIPVILRGLLDMSAFTLLDGGSTVIRDTQQYLNYNFYEHFESDFGLVPCDGLYGRQTALAFIYGLQALEGMQVGQSTGYFGDETYNRCPVIYKGQSNELIMLLKRLLACQGYEVNDYTTMYDGYFEYLMTVIANEYVMPRTENQISIREVKQLLTSCGDQARSALACDCATILDDIKCQELVNCGFQYVGRYLTGTVGNDFRDKALSKGEINALINKGLAVIPIYQDGGWELEYFMDISRASFDGFKAIETAMRLGFPNNTTIYFAVDFDISEADTNLYILPFFSMLKTIFNNPINSKGYNIGVYAPRLTCKILQENGLAKYSYVSDMSYGFSGNLSYRIPTNWAFDQFHETEEMTSFPIDKVAVSGKDLGTRQFEILTPEEEMQLAIFEKVYETFYESMDAFGLGDIIDKGNFEIGVEKYLCTLGEARITYEVSTGIEVNPEGEGVISFGSSFSEGDYTNTISICDFFCLNFIKDGKIKLDELGYIGDGTIHVEVSYVVGGYIKISGVIEFPELKITDTVSTSLAIKLNILCPLPGFDPNANDKYVEALKVSLVILFIFPILPTSTATGALTILSKLGGELSMGFASFLQLAMSLV